MNERSSLQTVYLTLRIGARIVSGMATFEQGNGFSAVEQSPYVIASIAYGSPSYRHIARERDIDGAARPFVLTGDPADVIVAYCGRVFPGYEIRGAFENVPVCPNCYREYAPSTKRGNARERTIGTHVMGASGKLIRARDVKRQQRRRESLNS